MLSTTKAKARDGDVVQLFHGHQLPGTRSELPPTVVYIDLSMYICIIDIIYIYIHLKVPSETRY